jgi:hypothetical protein
MHANLTLSEHLRRTEPANHEIHEITTGASLWTVTSPTTENIALLYPRTNLEKCEYRQVENLNLDG